MSATVLNSQLYVTTQTKRECDAAALLHGLPAGDHFAEMILRRHLDGMPEIAELQTEINAAARKARKAWEAKHVQTQTEDNGR